MLSLMKTTFKNCYQTNTLFHVRTLSLFYSVKDYRVLNSGSSEVQNKVSTVKIIITQICYRFPVKGLLFMILVEKKLNLSFYLWSAPHLIPETSMPKLIWESPRVTHLSFGLPFQHLFHPLVSAPTLSQVHYRQVSYIIQCYCVRIS